MYTFTYMTSHTYTYLHPHTHLHARTHMHACPKAHTAHTEVERGPGGEDMVWGEEKGKAELGADTIKIYCYMYGIIKE